MHRDILGIGLAGKSLSDLERRILRERPPFAIVLFGRNIGSAAQLRELIAEVKSASARPPLMMIDEEGGRVDRLRHLIPGLPSAEGFGEGDKPRELAEWHGRVIGMALRWFDIEVDLAPVVDIRAAVAPKGLERRIFGSDPETVVDLAGAFLRGLHAAGTAGVPKHFPGIGLGSADSHYGTTIINLSLDELLQRDLIPYQRLGEQAGAVMIGHGSYPNVAGDDTPATLSRKIAHDLLRDVLHFDGLAISDDMEMHAVSDLGSYESITERALMAGNDCVLFCSHVERVPDLQSHMERRVDEDGKVRARFDEAFARCERYRAHVERLRKHAPAPASFDDILDEAARFIEEFEKTRPHREVIVPDVDRRTNDRKPRTGREEWT
jgi:beta-N-acetylhexosaminidase